MQLKADQQNVTIRTDSKNLAAYDSSHNSEIIIPMIAIYWALCAKHLVYVYKISFNLYIRFYYPCYVGGKKKKNQGSERSRRLKLLGWSLQSQGSNWPRKRKHCAPLHANSGSIPVYPITGISPPFNATSPRCLTLEIWGFFFFPLH